MPYAITLIAFPIPYYLTHADLSYRQPLNPILVLFASVAFVSLDTNPKKLSGELQT
jgi:hypothetical protein